MNLDDSGRVQLLLAVDVGLLALRLLHRPSDLLVAERLGDLARVTALAPVPTAAAGVDLTGEPLDQLGQLQELSELDLHAVTVDDCVHLPLLEAVELRVEQVVPHVAVHDGAQDGVDQVDLLLVTSDGLRLTSRVVGGELVGARLDHHDDGIESHLAVGQIPGGPQGLAQAHAILLAHLGELHRLPGDSVDPEPVEALDDTRLLVGVVDVTLHGLELSLHLRLGAEEEVAGVSLLEPRTGVALVGEAHAALAGLLEHHGVRGAGVDDRDLDLGAGGHIASFIRIFWVIPLARPLASTDIHRQHLHITALAGFIAK